VRKKKLTEARRIQRIIAKDEPSLQILVDLDKMELCHLLNWYNQNRESDDSHDYLEQYCRENGIPATREQIDNQVATMGFVARLLTRNAKLDDRSMQWFNAHVDQMLKYVPAEKPKPKEVPVSKTPKDSISRHEYEKCFSDLEAAVDQFIGDSFKHTPNVEGIVSLYPLHETHRHDLVKFFEKQRDEHRAALDAKLQRKENEASEAYQNYTIVELRKMEAFYGQIIDVLQKKTAIPSVARKPRKKKVKTPAMQVKRMKFMEEDKTLRVKSIEPTKVVGASALWVYHVPSRILTQYVSNTDAGFEVKGCAILNYCKEKSQSKKLRKPEKVLPQVLNGGKVALRHILDDLTTKDAKVTGRVNSKTIILRALI